MLVRHGGNTWTQMHDGLGVDEFLSFLPEHARGLDEILEPEDAYFYRSLA